MKRSDDLDDGTVDFCKRDFKMKNGGEDLAGRHQASHRLRTQHERVKRTLSSFTQVSEIDFLFTGEDMVRGVERDFFQKFHGTFGEVSP